MSRQRTSIRAVRRWEARETKMDSDLEAPLLVESALEPVRYRVYPATPLSEVVDLIVRREVRALPVVGENFEVLGIITSGGRARSGVEGPTSRGGGRGPQRGACRPRRDDAHRVVRVRDTAAHGRRPDDGQSGRRAAPRRARGGVDRAHYEGRDPARPARWIARSPRRATRRFMSHTLAIIKTGRCRIGQGGQSAGPSRERRLQPAITQARHAQQGPSWRVLRRARGAPVLRRVGGVHDLGTGHFQWSLEADDAVAKLRETIGATDPAEAADGTVRKLYAESKGRNTIHASDSDENAANEIAFFFSHHERLGVA